MARLVPLLPPGLFKGLFIELERLTFLMVILPLFFLAFRPLGQARLERLVVLPLLPDLVLTVLILGPRELVVLQRQQDVGGALLPPFAQAVFGIAVQFWESPRMGTPAPLQTSHNTLWFGDGRVVCVNEDVRLIAGMGALPGVLASRDHFDSNEKVVVLLCLTQDLSNVLPLPRKGIPINSGDVDRVMAQGPSLVS